MRGRSIDWNLCALNSSDRTFDRFYCNSKRSSAWSGQKSLFDGRFKAFLCRDAERAMLALLSLGDQRRAYAEEHRSDSDHGLPVHSQVDDGMEACMKVVPCMSYERERLPTTMNLLSTYASLIDMAPRWSLQVQNRAMCHCFLCCRRDETRREHSFLF